VSRNRPGLVAIAQPIWKAQAKLSTGVREVSGDQGRCPVRVIEKSGHMMNLEAPREFNAEIVVFCMGSRNAD
jgi:pimeloyl-ACP methyl ester carboxylesterase